VNSRKHTALITGAAGGIGFELTNLLAGDGYDVVMVGRDRHRLETRAAELRARHHIAALCEVTDLSEPRAAFKLWSNVSAAGITIDVLVNNAGVGLYGAVSDQDPAELDRMVQLNVAALTALTRLVLPSMRERRWGRILNVASVVGYQPGGPWMAAYYATKSYVLSFSKGLAQELAGTGVSVTVLAPGPTDTLFDDAARANVDVLYKRFPKMTASAVARAGYEGMKRQATAVVPGFLTKVLAFAGELPPRTIALAFNRAIWKPRRGNSDAAPR
jgi:short-subunit dehydrogenase